MARELRVGDRVRTPRGTGTVTAVVRDHDGEHSHIVVDGEAHQRFFRTHALTPLPADIPRERVADLHAAVTKRVNEIEREDGLGAWRDESLRVARDELAKVAEALRLLLEPTDE